MLGTEHASGLSLFAKAASQRRNPRLEEEKHHPDVSNHRAQASNCCFSQRRTWKATPVFLPGESHGQRSLEGYSPYGLQSIQSIQSLTWLKRLCTHAHRSFHTSPCHVLLFLVLINLLRLSLLALSFRSGLGLSYHCSKDQAGVTASTSTEL